jgi:serine/threonine protein kinase
MLSKYRHPGIVLLLGAITSPPTLCIVMEYIKNGTLYQVLHQKKVDLNDKLKAKIAKQIISVIRYLHSHGVVHRDIKPHNMLIDGDWNVKVCDFGLARHKVSNLFIIVRVEHWAYAVQWYSSLHVTVAVHEERVRLEC